MWICKIEMYKYAQLFSIVIIVSTCAALSPHSRQSCGGLLTESVGVIQTPNFPAAFPVPIKCRWIIENDNVNGTITVYFTQQFTTSGLTFTEYTYYDDTYKMDQKRALTVTEENVTKVKMLQVTSRVLVIELSLTQLEGTQLRALGLLDVFGFNMTYSVRAQGAAPAQDSCSAVDCRLLGHCYATHDYQKFYCSCFEGYSGADCGDGPLCQQSPHLCKNGGTCRQLGAAGAVCLCAAGYGGESCEVPLNTPACGAAVCGADCRGNACACKPNDTASQFEMDREVPIKEGISGTNALFVQSLYIEQPEVWEGSAFTMRCLVLGSPKTDVTWWKDGVPIHFNATRHISTRVVVEKVGRLFSVYLTVPAARREDTGRWACSARELVVYCQSVNLIVRALPTVRLLPPALTVDQGSNVSLTCLPDARGRSYAWGVSWARARTLLARDASTQWEDLYPHGSLLTLFNVQKSGEYRCVVVGARGSAARSLHLWVLEEGAAACPAEEAGGRAWSRTAPQAHAVASCPPAYTGEAVRFCEPETGQHGVKWRQPNFSECLADSLKDIYEQFTRISLGYSRGSVSLVLQQYLTAVRSLAPLAGGGTVPLRHCRDMLLYLLSPVGNITDWARSAHYLLTIADHLLKHPDSFMDEENIFDLQNMVANAGRMIENVDMTLTQFSVATKLIHDKAAQFTFKPTVGAMEEWAISSAGLDLLVFKPVNATGVAIFYYNLEEKLPSLRRFLQFKSGRQITYELASPQIQLYASDVEPILSHTVIVLFTSLNNDSEIGISCAARLMHEPRAWNTELCTTSAEQRSVLCRCHAFATVALFSVYPFDKTEAQRRLFGFIETCLYVAVVLSFVAAAFYLLAVCIPRAPTSMFAPAPRSVILLHATMAVMHGVALLAFLHCDASQGRWCNVAEGFWAVGSAALCGGALTLRGEFAGTRSTHSLKLTSGACGMLLVYALLVEVVGEAEGAGATGVASRRVLAAGGALLCVAAFVLAVATARHLSSADKNRLWCVRYTQVLSVSSLAVQTTAVLCSPPDPLTPVLFDAAALQHCSSLLVMGMIIALAHIAGDSEEDADTASIKQGQEVDRSTVVVSTSSSRGSSHGVTAAYWRAPVIESSSHRAPCTADIVRCVERCPPSSALCGHGCDLLAHTHPQQHEASVPHPPVSLTNQHNLETLSPFLTYASPNNPSYSFQESCNICIQSNPDISKIPSPPVKSCLKKPKVQLTSSTSLPSIEGDRDESKNKSDIDRVNREWNKAFDSLDSVKVLHELSHDLDFLLNRTVDANSVLDQIKETPT